MVSSLLKAVMGTKTRRLRVFQLMSDRRWHSTMEINAVDVGGSEGCRRLREIRHKIKRGLYLGYVGIEKRRAGGDSTQYEYRLVPDPGPTPNRSHQLSLL